MSHFPLALISQYDALHSFASQLLLDFVPLPLIVSVLPQAFSSKVLIFLVLMLLLSLEILYLPSSTSFARASSSFLFSAFSASTFSFSSAKAFACYSFDLFFSILSCFRLSYSCVSVSWLAFAISIILRSESFLSFLCCSRC